MTLDEIICEFVVSDTHTPLCMREALGYLRDYRDLLIYLKVIDKNHWTYIKNRYLKDYLDDEVQH